MQYFTTQLNNHQQTTHSLRASQYRKRKKRRQDEEEYDSSSPEPTAKPTSTRGQSQASYALPEIAQLRVAGLSPEDGSKIPPPPFPHAAHRIANERFGANKIQEEIAKPPARLYAANAASKADSVNRNSENVSLRKQHLNVLSTLMHRCLLEQDYERAGRAWGMLLRTQVTGGHLVDPRNHGRWGIGAEILLRKEALSQPDQQNLHPGIFSEQGFELAREYYERLIIQYPNRKTAPNALDERSFYPAMFSFVLGGEARDTRAQEDAIQVEELARAMEIAERLDQLVASPPYDKHASLLQLRGHVGLWVSDLLSGKTREDEDWTMDTSEDVKPSNFSIEQRQTGQRGSPGRW
ncbi:hypothetical protein EK21DRAFT_96922 [Setomelanomma holmii]|uniref:Uncharacterized protein n=1 Tax=Setomelanomma holmii TaxID=210430 RepID=A0A9P4LSV9_9PLEO|nr:hypothetical protein EK21DRAFT_96922 [Setomelanomma holmii]